MLGSLLDAVEIVVVGRLRIMVVASRNDVAHIAALHGIISILVHKRIGCLQMTLVVLCGSARLVVHHQFHALGVGIVVEILYVEVGIRCLEVEHIVLVMTEPVFPSDVPTLYQHLLKSVLGSEVDVTLHVLGVGRMLSVGTALRVVKVLQIY